LPKFDFDYPMLNLTETIVILSMNHVLELK